MLTGERYLGALLALSGIVALGLAQWTEHHLGWAPCELCLIERMPWRALIGIGVLACLLRPDRARLLLWCGAGFLAADIGLAVLHSGVEHHWWESPFPSCHAPVFHAGSFRERLASMPLRPTKPCDAPNYLLDLPLSMAELGGVFALTVLGVLVWGLVRGRDAVPAQRG